MSGNVSWQAGAYASLGGQAAYVVENLTRIDPSFDWTEAIRDTALYFSANDPGAFDPSRGAPAAFLNVVLLKARDHGWGGYTNALMNNLSAVGSQQAAQIQAEQATHGSSGFLGLGDFGNLLAIGGLALTGFGLAGVGPLAGAIGGAAEAGAAASVAEAAAPVAVAEVPAATISSTLLPSEIAPGITLQSSGFGASILPDAGALALTPSGAIEAGATTPFLSNAPAGSVFSFANATPAVSAFNLTATAAALPNLPTPQAPSSPTSSAPSSIVDKAAAAVKSAAIGAAKSLIAPSAKSAAPAQPSGVVSTATPGTGGAGALLIAALIGLAFAR